MLIDDNFSSMLKNPKLIMSLTCHKDRHHPAYPLFTLVSTSLIFKFYID